MSWKSASRGWRRALRRHRRRLPPPLRRRQLGWAPEVSVSPLEAPAGAATRVQAIPITATSPPVENSEESVQLPFAGYMEFHLNKPRGESGQFDFHRFVLLFGHSFSSRIKFWSELELEHSLVEGGEEKGELELEQAYLDFYLNPYFNPARGNGAGADGGDQRAARAACLLWSRAPDGGHGDHPQHLV